MKGWSALDALGPRGFVRASCAVLAPVMAATRPMPLCSVSIGAGPALAAPAAEGVVPMLAARCSSYV